MTLLLFPINLDCLARRGPKIKHWESVFRLHSTHINILKMNIMNPFLQVWMFTTIPCVWMKQSVKKLPLKIQYSTYINMPFSFVNSPLTQCYYEAITQVEGKCLLTTARTHQLSLRQLQGCKRTLVCIQKQSWKDSNYRVWVGCVWCVLYLVRCARFVLFQHNTICVRKRVNRNPVALCKLPPYICC